MNGYATLTRIFHWVMALLILITIPVGIAMTSQGFAAQGDILYVTHKSLGVLILGLLALRLLWRWFGPSPPPLPQSVPLAEQRVALWTHRLMYALIGVMAVSGYLRTVGGGFPIEILDALGIPPLIGENELLATRLSVLHKVLGYVTVAVVALHVGAVAQHTWILKNRILWRMWPPWRGRA